MHLRPVHPERDLVVAVGAAGHDEGEVVEDALVEAVDDGDAVGGGEIDPGLPFLGRGSFPQATFGETLNCMSVLPAVCCYVAGTIARF